MSTLREIAIAAFLLAASPMAACQESASPSAPAAASSGHEMGQGAEPNAGPGEAREALLERIARLEADVAALRTRLNAIEAAHGPEADATDDEEATLPVHAVLADRGVASILSRLAIPAAITTHSAFIVAKEVGSGAVVAATVPRDALQFLRIGSPAALEPGGQTLHATPAPVENAPTDPIACTIIARLDGESAAGEGSSFAVIAVIKDFGSIRERLKEFIAAGVGASDVPVAIITGDGEGLEAVPLANATAHAVADAAARAGSPPSLPYDIAPSPDLKGRLGRLMIERPKDARCEEIVTKAGERVSSKYGDTTIDVFPGAYRVVVNNVVLDAVEVRSQSVTTIRLGALAVTAPSGVAVSVRRPGDDAKLVSTYGSVRWALPAGTYEVEVSGSRETVTVQAGSVTEL